MLNELMMKQAQPIAADQTRCAQGPARFYYAHISDHPVQSYRVVYRGDAHRGPQ